MAMGHGIDTKTLRLDLNVAETRSEDLIGHGVFHRGEFGTIIDYTGDTYDVPMYLVAFGARVAILRLTEIGRE